MFKTGDKVRAKDNGLTGFVERVGNFKHGNYVVRFPGTETEERGELRGVYRMRDLEKS